jgi:hypothetical protein
MCEIGLLSSVPNAWEKYTILMLYLQGGCCNTTHLERKLFLNNVSVLPGGQEVVIYSKRSRGVIV